MSSQRAKQACTACTRRKVKCSKTVPCANCVRRGETDQCTLDAGLGPELDGQPGIPPQEVHMLRRRVAELEAQIASTHRARLSTGPPPSVSPESDGTYMMAEPSVSTATAMPTAWPEMARPETARTPRAMPREHADTVIEDAASILEFLAWGRRKDPDFYTVVPAEADAAAAAMNTAAVGDVGNKDAPETDVDRADVLDSLDDLSQLAVVQMLLPEERTLWRLVDYHVERLMWFHVALHAPTFVRQVERFLQQHGGRVEAPEVDLQWVALLFSVLVGSLTCAPDHIVRAQWGIGDDERAVLSRRWFRASLACLNRAEYMANLSIVSVQAICTLTTSAHMLGFSNMQSIHLAAGVRIAQSLGLHRIGGSSGVSRQAEHPAPASSVEVETGRRVWLQLCCQDWFGIPFSESCLINPLHSQSAPPANCHDDGPEALRPQSEEVPTVASYSRFLTAIASIMPQLQDGLLSRTTPFTRYEQVLMADKRMRALATTGRPSFLANGPLDPAWPCWVPWARRSLAITSAHKIIMIHRSFLSESLTNPAYAFTRRTCLAAAKTIIKEYCAVDAATAADDDGPILWVHQAFSVAASIILILDVLHRSPDETEYAPHLQLTEEAVRILRRYTATSLIAARGVKLLSALLVEAHENEAHSSRETSTSTTQKRQAADPEASPSGTMASSPQPSRPAKRSRGLDVPAFVRSFCGSLANPRSSETAPMESARLDPAVFSSDDGLMLANVSQQGTAGQTADTAAMSTELADRLEFEQNGLFLLPSAIDHASVFGNLLYLANFDFPGS